MEAIKQEPYEIVDTDFGDIVSCEAVPHDKDSDSFHHNLGTGCMSGNPLYSPWMFRVTYVNGVQAVVEGRGWMVMSSQGLPGFIEKRPEGLKDSPRWRGRYGNSRLMATIAAKIRDCGYFPSGPVELIPSDQVEAVFKDCGIRNRPCDIDDEWLARVEKEWPERWLKAGLVVKPNPDEPFVEAKWWRERNASELQANLFYRRRILLRETTIAWILLVITLLIYLGMFLDGVNRRKMRDERCRNCRHRNCGCCPNRSQAVII